MNKKIIGFVLLISLIGLDSLLGQLPVKILEKLELRGYGAIFSSDADHIVFIGSESKEYMQFDLNSEKATELGIAANGKLVKLDSSDHLVVQDRKSENHLTILNLTSGHKKELPKGGLVIAYPSEDLRSIILNDGSVRKELKPLDLADYINVSLSPDQSKILFRASGIGTFIVDLKGNIIAKFASGQFPTWVNNSKILFAKITDNGHQYTSSSLYFGDINSQELTPIEVDNKIIPLFPSANKDGSKIIFNTPENQLFLLKLR